METKPESAAVEAVAWWVPNARACQDGSWEEGPGYLKFSDETDGAERKYGTALYPQSALDALRGEVSYYKENFLSCMATLNVINDAITEADEEGRGFVPVHQLTAALTKESP